MWRDVGRACGWKHPRAPPVGRLFDDDRATPAVFTFLRSTKAGRTAALGPSRGGGRGGVGRGRAVSSERDRGTGGEGGEGGPGPP